jgi:hypothetical protein
MEFRMQVYRLASSDANHDYSACAPNGASESVGMTRRRRRVLTAALAAFCFALSAGFGSAVNAEILTCSATEAWRLEASGLSRHPDGFYGLKETAVLHVDTAAGTVSSASGPLPGLVLTSRFNAETGANLVLSTPDGSLLFRARDLGNAKAFMLIDTYDIYTGQCGE